MFKLNLDTTKKFKLKVDNLIPLHVYVTWKTLDLPFRMKQNYMNLRKKNSRFNFHLYDEDQCRDFIQTYFPSALEAFDILIPSSYKANLWSLCVLYQFGGIYMDSKLECLGNFDLYSLVDKEHFVIDTSTITPHIYDGLMVCKPNNSFLLESIEQIIKNVNSNYYGESYLSPTGSEMLGRIGFQTLNLDMSLNLRSYIKYKNVIILKKNEYGLVNDSVLWKNKNIYVKPFIPLHVYVTWKTLNLPPKMMQNYRNLRKKNPEFNFHLFDDTQCRAFIQTYFPTVVDVYDSLIPGAYKADLWSFCVLYQFGGIYMDSKLECLNFKLYSLIDKEHFVIDRPTHSPHIYNSFMVCKPKNPFLLECIEQLIQNVTNHYYGESSLSPTGPEMLGRIATKYSLNVDMNHSRDLPTHIMYKNVAILKNYDGYNGERLQYSSTMWKNKNIYEYNERLEQSRIKNIVNPVVPLDVYLTWKTLDLPPKMKQHYSTLCTHNPEFKFHLYDDDQCRDFIQTYFPSALEAFDKLIPGAYKADLWRLCVLYQCGGIYMDCKIECIGNFKLYSIVDKEHFVKDRPTNSPHIYNAFMVCKPNNSFLLECIEQIIKNVKNNYYGEGALSPTGPEMLGRIAPKHSLNLDMVHSHERNKHIMYKNVAILKNYDGYYAERTINYGDLWINKTIYKV